MNNKIIKALGMCICLPAVIVVFLLSGCSLWQTDENASGRPLVIKAEDFSIFLFESSEEIYRANVKDQTVWAGLREKANRDAEYAAHYSWLYDTYGKWDDHRRAQLKEIFSEYYSQPMSERLVQNGKQEAGLDEIIKFIREDRFFKSHRDVLIDFYSWYGSNYAMPHYEQIKPLLQRKVEIAAAMVDKGFDIVSFLEKETGIHLKKKPDSLELLLNMRMIGFSGFTRKKDSLATIQWNRGAEKIWEASFHEFSKPFFRTFTGSWSFKYLAGKLKKDEKLMARFKEDVPYTWEGWVEENLVEGYAKYLNVRKGITRDVGEGIYVFDRDYAQALVSSFDPQKTTLEEFTVNYLKKTYNI
ncbi:MAG: hypothetical protein A4E55_01532 [Pelotomaculum sp. PtaU1.Bin035]|nr:MAG: hypothetical protein A4E55_01532 [Pelotomaculum sp. PtaU1.Bin035]